MFDRINVHPADAGALAAVNACRFIDGQPIEADFIEQAIDRSKRTGQLAEEAIDQNAADDRDKEKKGFPAKQRADSLSQFEMCTQKRNAAHQSVGGADILTESRCAHAYDVGDKNRHEDHEHEQKNILGIFGKRRQAQFFLWQRNHRQQFLKQTKRAQEAADEASQQHAGS